MKLDVRLPIGWLFTCFGCLLTLFGFWSDPKIYAEHSLGLNINLYWGLVLLLFGLLMLGFTAWSRARRR